eukprot:CAMPEP_0202386312 /NCGR_PEP_ID=MMETSP1127-20130417/65721_1 /ASSEMBLY_ACC=CAM_ASM_000462 /TAXON_ID=3047 /ORGANISM="Dunaliella tertiolecta, Strain CCMP1320" /LENGTH=50 /DNA_ID=CAMNT_0048986789 /DNA_START=1113 /DNA_END=1265 /DNA_ORIENTATION=-
MADGKTGDLGDPEDPGLLLPLAGWACCIAAALSMPVEKGQASSMRMRPSG